MSGHARGLFVMENPVGHLTVYQNMKAAARGTPTRVELVTLGERRGVGGLPMPAVIGESLTLRDDVHRLVRRAWPEYLISNTHKPVVFCHDLFGRLPSGIMLDATPRQFDRLRYFEDRTDRLPGVPRLKYLLVRSLFRRAAALLPWSTWAARSLINEYGAPPERVVVIPPGIDTDAWEPPPDKPRRPRPTVIFLGGDLERKGGPELLEWFRRFGRGRAELTLVTHSPVAEEDGVRVTRASNNSERLRELVRQADLFVLPSRADCFSLAALEAMASGLPTVLSDVGGTADIVEHGVTGYLVPPGDPAKLGEALDALLSSDAVRRDMGDAARARAISRFDSRRAFERIAAVGARIAAGQPLQPDRP